MLHCTLHIHFNGGPTLVKEKTTPAHKTCRVVQKLVGPSPPPSHACPTSPAMVRNPSSPRASLCPRLTSRWRQTAGRDTSTFFDIFSQIRVHMPPLFSISNLCIRALPRRQSS